MSSKPAMPQPPLVAILRGLQPERAAEVGLTLYQAGFRMLEVPLNRPGALAAIRNMVESLPADALIGAGTVLSVAEVEALAATGARLSISPDCNPAVIARAAELGLLAIPGVATPSEAFAALRAGAWALKAFPAEALPPQVIKAWRAVVPAEVPILPVGGVRPEDMAAYIAGGASGFGLGGQLYQVDFGLAEIAARAHAYLAAWQALAR